MAAALRLVALMGAITLVACGPGPMPATPTVPGPKFDFREDWFKSDSEMPWDLDDAIRSDHIDEVRRLLEGGADPNRRWSQSGDHFPLQEIVDTGGGYRVADPAEMIRLLLAHGANPNARWCPFESRTYSFAEQGCMSARGAVALTFAAAAGWTDVVELLLGAGADPAARDWRGVSALDVVASDVAFELISRALFPVVETRDQNALSWIRSGVSSDGGLFTRAIDSDSYYLVPLPPIAAGDPMSWAHRRSVNESRVIERLRPLLRIGADPNQSASPNGQLHTALGLAVRRGLPRAARTLLTGGADPNQRECIARYDYKTSKVMLEPRCTNQNGITPLMSAASAGDREGVGLLLEFKADRSLKDWAGQSALDHAKDGSVRQLLGTPSAFAKATADR